MFQSVLGILGAPFTELIIFVLLVAYVVIHRHDKRLAGISRLKIFILLIIFVYFAWMPIVWPSLIPSSMLTLSVFGMFVVNFYLFYSLILARIEWPYRERPSKSGRGTEKPGAFSPNLEFRQEILLLLLYLSVSGQRHQSVSLSERNSHRPGAGRYQG